MAVISQCSTIICKLTGATGKPVKAHIIPECFYLIRPEHVGKMKLVNSANDSYVKRCQTGIYDTTIVTEEGERRFRDWDNYACDLLVNQFSRATRIPKYGKPKEYQYLNYDYAALKLFFLSILWRAGVSSQPFFVNVKLGSHEPLLRAAILDSDPGDEQFYSVALAVFDDHMEYLKMVNPFPETHNGIAYYRFHLGNIIAYIKVDERNTPFPLSGIQMTRAQPLRMIQQDFVGSAVQQKLKMLHDCKKHRAGR